MIDGGYIEGSTYHFYLTDHLGNNRVVANASGTAVQRNHYYPFGMPYAETPITEQSKQPYKFGDKELDQMHGLNHYDFSARYMDGIRFTSVDPMAEKYYSISPYVYCANNPIRWVDRDGRSFGVPIPIPYLLPPPIASGSKEMSTTEQYHAVGQALVDLPGELYKFTENNRQVVSMAVATMILVELQNIGVLEANPHPGYTHQEKEGKKAKEALDGAQASVAKAIQDNFPNPNLDDGGGPKRPLTTWEKIIAYAIAGLGTIQQASNPDASKDAHEAHLEDLQKEQKDLEKNKQKSN